MNHIVRSRCGFLICEANQPAEAAGAMRRIAAFIADASSVGGWATANQSAAVPAEEEGSCGINVAACPPKMYHQYSE